MKANANPATYTKNCHSLVDANKLRIVHKIVMIMIENIMFNVVSLSKNSK